MNARTAASDVSPQLIHFTLDGNEVAAFDGETIFSAAKRHGVDIPHLCFKEGYRADGNCRALKPVCCLPTCSGDHANGY